MKIFVFTEAYPFGRGEQFLETEMAYLAEAFEQVVVLPRRYDGNREARVVPEGVKVLRPIFPREEGWALLWKGLWNLGPVAPLWHEFFRARVYGSVWRFRKWLEASLCLRAVTRHPEVRRGVREIGPDGWIYFYWGKFAAWSAPFLPPGTRRLARFHGHDIYEERSANRGYIPYRRDLFNGLDLVVAVSTDGLIYLAQRYGDVISEAHVFRLGVARAGKVCQRSTDGRFRVVTCSSMLPLKRLPIVMEALKALDGPASWTHLGDGPERERLERLAEALPTHVKCHFPGRLTREQVLAYYENNPVDLFLNLSETEGLPVSIMEALAAGIPVMATDVGGTAELVDETIGALLPKDITPEILTHMLQAYLASPARWPAYSAAALRRWDEVAHAEKNFGAFIAFLQRAQEEPTYTAENPRAGSAAETRSAYDGV